ncbi:RNA-directed DNA polymerase, eukaryota, reverse transcriptase zinc-binding domain protein [Tanacetum coccineum]
MGSFRTKEDDVAKISTSVFITNFPESCSTKELFQSCKQYDHVVDTFIPTKKSKNGRRFGFVRFINVFNEERLVNNLCTVWIDRFKLHANIARFHRPPLREKNVIPKRDGGGKSNNSYVFKEYSGFNGGGILEAIQTILLRFVPKKLQDGFLTSWKKTIMKNRVRLTLRRVNLKFMIQNSKEDVSSSVCSGHFKKSGVHRTGGSILNLMDELVKAGQVMGYKMDGCLAQKAKKDWVKELCVKNKVNFMALQETKMENTELFSVKMCWGNFAFDYVHSDSVSNSRGANVFNSFTINAGLEEVPLGGSAFTWCHKSASKMSKLDRFLVSENLIYSCPNINAITLERYLSDHRPILLREASFDYGPTSEVAFKAKIREWNKSNMLSVKNVKAKYKEELEALEAIIDRGDGNEEIVNKRTELESEVSNVEIKRAVWDCGTDKSPGPDGFTFGFYRRFWKIIENDVYDAVKYFFTYGNIPKGCNSSFIALILKIPDANMVKDFRPISLIGSLYKIIAKILANRLVGVLGDIVNEVQSAFIAERQILDGPFILNEILQWSKTKKKQSLIFKVDFEKAYDSLRINMSKSKILGVNVDSDKVKGVASKLGCLILKTPFTYLGSKVGGSMSRVHAWNEVIDRVKNRLSKWKMKTLSIGDGNELGELGRDFSVAKVRKIIDIKSLWDVDSKTRG